MSEPDRPRGVPSAALGVWTLLLGLLAAGLVASLWLFDVAGAQNGSTISDASRARDHVTVLNSQGRFTGPGDWPPAPHEARTPLLRSNRPVDIKRGQVVERLESHPEVQAMLGEKYSLVSSSHPASERAGAAKGELDRSQLKTVWFSRSTNQTIIARSDAAGVRPSDVSTVPAGSGQPDLTGVEDDMAIALARAFWADQGDPRIDDLKGFSIWALHEDGRVYDVRMAYVSFHPTREHEPELITWVDLTNEAIVRSEVVR